MSFREHYYDGFRDKWQAELDRVAERSGLESVLVMRSTPTHMVTVVSAGPATRFYHPGDKGPKSVNPGCHKLYCEQVVNTRRELHVPDASADPEWRANEDLVNFGLGVYLGFPITGPDGEVLGTVCGLHNRPFDFDAGRPSTRELLEGLRNRIQDDLGAAAA